MDKLIRAFQNAERLIDSFERTSSQFEFSEPEDAIQIHAMLSIAHMYRYVKAVNILLSHELLTETLPLLRSVTEAAFNLLWIIDNKDGGAEPEVLNRLYSLEKLSIESQRRNLEKFRKAVGRDAPSHVRQLICAEKEMLERRRRKLADAIKTNCDSDDVKGAPNLWQRLDAIRELPEDWQGWQGQWRFALACYYSHYSSLSEFIHVSPSVKRAYLHFDDSTDDTPSRIVIVHQALRYTLPLMHTSLACAQDIYQAHELTGEAERSKIINDFEMILSEAGF